MTLAKIVGMFPNCRIILTMVSPSTASIRNYVQLSHLFVYETRTLGMSLKCCLKFDSWRTDDHIFRHRRYTIKYSPKTNKYLQGVRV